MDMDDMCEPIQYSHADIQFDGLWPLKRIPIVIISNCYH